MIYSFRFILLTPMYLFALQFCSVFPEMPLFYQRLVFGPCKKVYILQLNGYFEMSAVCGRKMRKEKKFVSGRVWCPLYQRNLYFNFVRVKRKRLCQTISDKISDSRQCWTEGITHANCISPKEFTNTHN